MTPPTPPQSEPPRVILASASARRADLLREAGIDFTQRPAPFDDTGLDWHDAAPARSCEALAWLKATSLADTIAPHDTDAQTEPAAPPIILAADTIAELDGRILGKPADADAARAMIAAMAGREHTVITAVAMICMKTQAHRLFHDAAAVTLGALSDEVIDDYVESRLWVGKAGGYNLGEMRQAWSIQVTGDPTTVIGLPVRRVVAELSRFGVQTGDPHAPEPQNPRIRGDHLR